MSAVRNYPHMCLYYTPTTRFVFFHKLEKLLLPKLLRFETKQNSLLNRLKTIFNVFCWSVLRYIGAELRKRKLSGITRIAPTDI